MKLISNFDQLTKQDIFDMALAHVRKNGKQSMHNGVCCYTGIGCAASVFIDPESLAKLSRDDNSRRWNILVKNNGLSTHENSLVSQLQWCHDMYVPAHDLSDAENDELFMRQYEQHMRALADKLDLTYTLPS